MVTGWRTYQEPKVEIKSKQPKAKTESSKTGTKEKLNTFSRTCWELCLQILSSYQKTDAAKTRVKVWTMSFRGEKKLCWFQSRLHRKVCIGVGVGVGFGDAQQKNLSADKMWNRLNLFFFDCPFQAAFQMLIANKPAAASSQAVRYRAVLTYLKGWFINSNGSLKLSEFGFLDQDKLPRRFILSIHSKDWKSKFQPSGIRSL